MTAVQDLAITQPTCPSLLEQIRSFFEEKPRRIWCICRSGLDQIKRKCWVPSRRCTRLGYTAKAFQIYTIKVWC